MGFILPAFGSGPVNINNLVWGFLRSALSYA
jgi:hypothetical protein